MPITINNKSMPLQGDEKTLIQRLRNYIDPVDKGWFNRLQPANEVQIDELKQQLELNKVGIELPLVYSVSRYMKKQRRMDEPAQGRSQVFRENEVV